MTERPKEHPSEVELIANIQYIGAQTFGGGDKIHLAFAHDDRLLNVFITYTQASQLWDALNSALNDGAL